jgi:hypothetical protein
MMLCPNDIAIKDLKEIWEDDEVTDGVEDEIEDGRITPV